MTSQVFQIKKTLFEKITFNRHISVEDGDNTLVLPVDQVLLQDATGTLTTQALDVLDLTRINAPLAVQYIDHNLLQSDFRNADDHRYLREAASSRGVIFSPPGNGISHPVHMELFSRPGNILAGTDSHSCAAGAIGMLAIGLGSLAVAGVLAGEPLRLKRPRVIGVSLSGQLPAGVSAKDVILEMLRRLGTAGASHAVLEYFGPGVASLDLWDRHVIANMGAETGAVTSIFPSDARTAEFLDGVGRADEMIALEADEGAEYDQRIDIALDQLVPLVALPSSPGNVVTVSEVEGTSLSQVFIGSSANPGFRDFAAAAAILENDHIADGVTLEVNPTSRTVLRDMIASGVLARLLEAGGRLHQTGCNGCNGMGQAPGTGMNSLRTVPRNFPGRSGTKEDRIYLASPETAAASALTGKLTDPRGFADRLTTLPKPATSEPATRRHLIQPGKKPLENRFTGPNIKRIPDLPPFKIEFDLPILLHLGDDVSTDAISPAGAAALPYRSNLEKLAEFTFRPISEDYVSRAKATPKGHAIMAGRNYGQGSSREHAALCPRLLGLRLVIAQSVARIHRENLISSGVLILTAPETISRDIMHVSFTLSDAALSLGRVSTRYFSAGREIFSDLAIDLSIYERKMLLSGGLLRHLKRENPTDVLYNRNGQ